MSLTATQRQTLSWAAIGLVACLLLWRLAPVLTPFIVGAGLAYALLPAVERLVRRGWRRPLAVLLVETAAITVVLALLLLIVPVLTRELPLLKEQLPLLVDRLDATLTPWLAQYGVQVSFDMNSVRDFIVKHWDANSDDWLSRAFASARIGGSYVLAIVGNAVLVPLVLFYLLMDWPRIAVQLQMLVPPRQRERFASFMGECDQVLGQYLRGQLLVMLLLALYYAVGLALFGFHLALPVGVITGLLVFIPYLGFGLGLALALVAALLQFGGWYGLGSVAVVYGFGQLLESFYLTPRLVGERIGLSPLAVVFALLAFGELFGFVGVLIALPVSAVMLVAVRRVQGLYLGSRLYLG
ncbi:AI-2E family transporter [Ideonella sp. BN130291]|uniref:AI-2E family transporter n=1 Tax=Ideonella sp. BN130291 TaxID=3112940 RepID=UPI002E254FF8|nr:AI-2E family transporter [Ideonella sp. BN130291]